MTQGWLDSAQRVDMSADHGYGPFLAGGFLGVVLHVNVAEHGTSDAFFRSNPDSVCPNFQVFKSEAEGGTHQYLPLDCQPWCQSAGNYRWAAIETAGMPDEPLTAYQIQAIATIVAAYHDQLGMPLQVTDSPNVPGLGTHEMGGAAWGGHPCPGTIRAAQRTQILAAIPSPAPQPPAIGTLMSLTAEDQAWFHREMVGTETRVKSDLAADIAEGLQLGALITEVRGLRADVQALKAAQAKP